MKNKKVILSKIKLCKAELEELINELIDLENYTKNDKQDYYYFSPVKERSKVSNRITTVRNDLLQLKRELYKQ